MARKRLTLFPSLGRARKRTQGTISRSALPQPLESPPENILLQSISKNRQEKKISRSSQHGFFAHSLP